MNGKFGSLIEQARKQGDQKQEENQKSAEPDNQNTVVDPDVNLCTKVPLSLRRHWSAEAKRKGVTLTAVITSALTKTFGRPE